MNQFTDEGWLNLNKPNGLYSSILPGKKEIKEEKDKRHRIPRSHVNAPNHF